MAEEDVTDYKTITAPVEPDLWAQMKAKAALEQRPLYQLLHEALSDYLANGKDAPQKMKRRR